MFTFSGLVSIPRTMDLLLHLKFGVTVSRLHWSCEFSLGFLNVFKRLKLREKMVSLSRERKVTLFLSLCIWLPALSFLYPSQTMNREFGGVSCRPAVQSLLESLSYKWRARAGWEVMSYWWLISAYGGKNDSLVNWACSWKRNPSLWKRDEWSTSSSSAGPWTAACTEATGWGVSLCHRAIIYIIRSLAHLFPQSRGGVWLAIFYSLLSSKYKPALKGV